MYQTYHLQARMRQRGISKIMLETVWYFGTVYGDKIVLGRKELRKELDLLDQQRKNIQRKGNKESLDLLNQRRQTFLKAMDKGGIVLVEESGSGITAYNHSGLKNRV